MNSYLTTIRQAVEGPPGHPYEPSTFYTELLALEPQSPGAEDEFWRNDVDVSGRPPC